MRREAREAATGSLHASLHTLKKVHAPQRASWASWRRASASRPCCASTWRAATWRRWSGSSPRSMRLSCTTKSSNRPSCSPPTTCRAAPCVLPSRGCLLCTLLVPACEKGAACGHGGLCQASERLASGAGADGAPAGAPGGVQRDLEPPDLQGLPALCGPARRPCAGHAPPARGLPHLLRGLHRAGRHRPRGPGRAECGGERRRRRRGGE